MPHGNRMTSIAPARPGAGQRLAALAALVIAAAVLLTAAEIAISQFPRGLVVLALIVAALAAAWFGLLRTGILRLLGAGIAVAAIAAAVVLLLTRGENLLEILLGNRSQDWRRKELPQLRLTAEQELIFPQAADCGGS